MFVYKHECMKCGYTTWSEKGDKKLCSKCRAPYNNNRIEFNNMFNIQAFLKSECNGFAVSKPVLALSDEAIQTFVTIIADYAMRNATKDGAKTILPGHFDWNIIEKFKVFISNRYE